MDNKYGLGSTRVAQEHNGTHAKSEQPAQVCRFCGHDKLTLCQTMQDHRCNNCGEWQNDAFGYSTGRSADY